jgi:NADH:ubiquinone oxidoreductase subunit 5 (subunit L)/multisubunit Na+/H+ antiporter MnhA subunit
MYINVVLLPLLNFIIIFFLGSYIGRLGSCFISVMGLFVSLLISLYIFFEVAINDVVTSSKLYNLINIDLYSIQ